MVWPLPPAGATPVFGHCQNDAPPVPLAPGKQSMDNHLLVGLASSLLGGAIVALITYLSTRKRTEAEARKLDAETERTKAETTRLLSEMRAATGTRTPGGAVPTGWRVNGSYPADYEAGTDTAVAHSGSRSGFLVARPEARGFGTLMQTFRADRFRGRRLRMSAFVRTADVEHLAGLWMRVDGPDETTLSFDNMQDRPILGTTDWRQYRIVLDVPANSEVIAFGVLLGSSGQVWLDDVAFEAVDKDTPTTGADLDELPAAPVNLDFDTPAGP